MEIPNRENPSEQVLCNLEQHIGALLKHCTHLQQKNHDLHTQLQNLQLEQRSLLQKIEYSKSRIETMLQQLKALEDTS